MSASPGDRIREAFVTVLWSGYAPVASGTFGSAAAIVIYVGAFVAATQLGITHVWFDLAVAGPAIIAACMIGVALGPWAIARYGREDPKPFVLDEFAGQWTALLLLPPIAFTGWLGLAAVLASQFFLFRLLDVIKPPPAMQIDRDWSGGWGITFDDVVAGIYANLLGQLLWRFTPLASWIAAITST